jgi:uncharacterized membrane protein YbjE (DUF340 family)
MGTSVKIIIFFVLGIIMGHYRLLPDFILDNDLSVYALYLLLFLVGLQIGMDKQSFEIIRHSSFRLILVPLAVIIGSLLGAAVVGLILKDLTVKDSLAIGSGFGYYSLSSILIAEIKSKSLGVVALLANIFRELTTLIFTPLFARLFGPLAPIASGGATAMDTTLPIITEYSGKEYALVSVFSGLVLTLLVPLLVSFFCYL